MNSNKLENILLCKNGSVKEFPFGDDVAVFKIMNKIFALYGYNDNKINLNLKCLPEDALGYRDIYKCVIPGYHMNKKHWNTIIIDGTMSDEILINMIDESYDLIIAKLTKKEKIQLNLL